MSAWGHQGLYDLLASEPEKFFCNTAKESQRQPVGFWLEWQHKPKLEQHSPGQRLLGKQLTPCNQFFICSRDAGILETALKARVTAALIRRLSRTHGRVHVSSSSHSLTRSSSSSICWHLLQVFLTAPSQQGMLFKNNISYLCIIQSKYSASAHSFGKHS